MQLQQRVTCKLGLVWLSSVPLEGAKFQNDSKKQNQKIIRIESVLHELRVGAVLDQSNECF